MSEKYVIGAIITLFVLEGLRAIPIIFTGALLVLFGAIVTNAFFPGKVSRRLIALLAVTSFLLGISLIIIQHE